MSLCRSGLEDELIPPWHMRILYNVSPERAGGGKRIFTVADGTHNDTWERGGSAYLKALDAFIDEVRWLTFFCFVCVCVWI